MSAHQESDDLFTQPDSSYLGDCPVCCLPLPIDRSKSGLNACCSQLICMGCHYSNHKREIEGSLEHRCVYCREPLPKSEEEALNNIKKRAKKNDPVALCQMGKRHHREGDYGTALKYLTEAAELGYANAHYELSIWYREGEGVEEDKKKYFYHTEEAAIGGHPMARHNLGYIEAANGNFERAKKHYIIAANFGYQNSLNGLRQLHADGHASKEDYAGALRAYQVAVDATKSAEREKAEAYFKSLQQS